MQTSVDQLWREATAALAARNGPLDLAAARADGGAPEWYRSRLLAAGAGGEMVVERPGVPGAASALGVGAAVRVTVMVDGRRLEATATVQAAAMVSLNKAVSVPALRLSPAADVRSAQRRRFYRIALTSLDLPGLTLRAGADAAAPELEAHLVNLSAGGLGVRVPLTTGALAALRREPLLRCEVMLPGPGDGFPLSLPMRLLHVEPMPPQGAYLGLAFVFPDGVTQRRAQDELVKFVTEVERKQLRRQRGAG